MYFVLAFSLNPNHAFAPMQTHASSNVRSSRITIRAKVASLRTITKRQATRSHASPMTFPYQTRNLDQCVALLNVIRDFAACPDRLLFVRSRRDGEIEVWRKG
jgi:hypothetical protein